MVGSLVDFCKFHRRYLFAFGCIGFCSFMDRQKIPSLVQVIFLGSGTGLVSFVFCFCLLSLCLV